MEIALFKKTSEDGPPENITSELVKELGDKMIPSRIYVSELKGDVVGLKFDTMLSLNRLMKEGDYVVSLDKLGKEEFMSHDQVDMSGLMSKVDYFAYKLSTIPAKVHGMVSGSLVKVYDEIGVRELSGKQIVDLDFYVKTTFTSSFNGFMVPFSTVIVPALEKIVKKSKLGKENFSITFSSN